MPAIFRILFLLFFAPLFANAQKEANQTFKELQKLVNNAAGQKISYFGDQILLSQTFAPERVSAVLKDNYEKANVLVLYEKIPWDSLWAYNVTEDTSNAKVTEVTLEFFQKFTWNYTIIDAPSDKDSPMQTDKLYFWILTSDLNSMDKLIRAIVKK